MNVSHMGTDFIQILVVPVSVLLRKTEFYGFSFNDLHRALKIAMRCTVKMNSEKHIGYKKGHSERYDG